MMEKFCESLKRPAVRPASRTFVELLVLFVPAEQWNVELKKVPADVADSFISAGFIRVCPEASLRTLRAELAVLLGTETDAHSFSFLKRVGRSLALVKGQQESDLKAKTFAPPYAAEPELYLLAQCSQQPAGPGGARERSSGSSSSSEEDPERGGPLQLLALTRALERIEADSSRGQISTGREDTQRNMQHQHGDQPSVKETDRSWKRDDGLTDSTVRNEAADLVFSDMAGAGAASSPDLLPDRKQRAACLPLSAEALLEEVKLLRDERRTLELRRQQLLRAGRDLMTQNRNRRNRARDGWRRKYFETKKASAPLEELLRAQRTELETASSKVLLQLQARDRTRRLGRPSEKNELITQIVKEGCEAEDLRAALEDARMKLSSEMKLRKQAALELRDLKAELSQKKNRSAPSWMAQNHDLGRV